MNSRIFCLFWIALVTLVLIPAATAETRAVRPPMIFETDEGPQSVAVGELDGDNSPDLVTANWESDNVSVLLGNGDGTFQDGVVYAAGDSPQAVIIGDFDSNGNLDLAVANGDSDNVSVLMGNGDGTFQPAVNYTAGLNPVSVASSDLDGDTNPDLVVANGGDDTVLVLLGNGDGTFLSAGTYAAGDFPRSVALDDLDGDSNHDLAVANAGSDTVSVLLGNGDGTFQTVVNFGTGDYPRSVVIGDLDADSNPDLAVVNDYSSTVSVLLGYGDGSFQAAVNYDTGLYPRSAALGDLNGDSDLDIVVANYADDDVSVLMGHGDGTFQPAADYRTGEGPSSVAVDDLDDDGIPDLAVANVLEDSITVLLGYGDGTFPVGTFFPAVSYPTGDYSRSVAIDDLDSDGIPDLAVAAYMIGYISILLGNGDGTFQTAVNYDAIDQPQTVAIGDLDNDGIPDLVTGNLNQVTVLLGNGDGTFQTAVSVYQETEVWNYSAFIGDFDDNGNADLAVVSSLGWVAVLLGNGDGTFQPRMTHVISDPGSSLAVGDLNRDGDQDLAVTHPGYTSNGVSILLGNGDGTFNNGGPCDAVGWCTSVAIDDLDGDSNPDLALGSLSSGSSNRVYVNLGNGDGTFQPRTLYQIGGGSHSVAIAIADLDLDSDPDLAVTYGSVDKVSILFGNGDGTFMTAMNYGVGADPWAVAAGDLDGDTLPDLAVANDDSDNVSVLINSSPLPETEPNDDCTAAHDLGDLISGKHRVVVGETNPVGDEDLYGFSTDSGFITATLAWDGSEDLDLNLGTCDGGTFIPLASSTSSCPETVSVDSATPVDWVAMVDDVSDLEVEDYVLSISWTSCADGDDDGYLDEVCGGNDCNDADEWSHPGAVEDCDDSEDNDCDGWSDSDDPDCSGLISVPYHYDSIQQAIDAASAGYIITVDPGTYTGPIDFQGMAITLRSEQGPSVTTIDGNGSGSVVNFSSGEDRDSVLEGFTLTNGSTDDGGGINCNGASPTIIGNVISLNSASSGGGINCSGASPAIIGNVISLNTASNGGGINCRSGSSPLITDNIVELNWGSADGGGIHCHNSSPTITSNTINGNMANDDGAGLYCYNYSGEFVNNLVYDNAAGDWGGGIGFSQCNCTISNNTIIGNSGVAEGGGLFCYDSIVTVVDTIIWDNYSALGPDIYLGYAAYPSTLNISYSDVEGGQSAVHVDPNSTLNWGAGMIDADPLFVTGLGGGYYLSQISEGEGSDSPCLDAGSVLASSICFTSAEGAVCLDELTTRSGHHDVDTGTADMGYHHEYWCCDCDGDLYDNDDCGGLDCDDSDDTIYPGATEICDGKDNDCSGFPDSDEADDDEDGYMICEGDCNDSDPEMNPGLVESLTAGNCADGKDNDCDGDTDSQDSDCGVTMTASLTCMPGSGTLPFSTQMTVTLNNEYQGLTRRIAGRLNVTKGNGQSVSNWKSGWSNIAAGSSLVNSWNQNIPALGSLLGNNIFTLEARDVTPSPYNQPPHPPAGDTDSEVCTVTGVAP